MAETPPPLSQVIHADEQFRLNMVERFFRDLTEERLRRGIFRDVDELIMTIGDYIDRHNDKPKPFVWTAKAFDILEEVKCARTVLDNG